MADIIEIKLTTDELDGFANQLMEKVAQGAEVGDMLECGIDDGRVAIQVEVVCPDCRGAGEVTVDEQVYPGEPHMAPIGKTSCHCFRKDA